MATPTLANLQALAIAWWQAPGLPNLDTLVAQIAQIWTDPGAIVRAQILNNSGVYSIRVELERNGTIVGRTWTPTNGQRQETLADIYCASLGGTLNSTGQA